MLLRRVYWDAGKLRLQAEAPAGPAALFLEETSQVPASEWRPDSVVRLPLEAASLRLETTPPADQRAGFYRLRYKADDTLAAARLRCLYDGYFLTVDPARALAPDSLTNRYRLYVLHAVLINPETGRIAAIWPPWQTEVSGEPVARPLTAFPALSREENPPPPGGRGPAELLDWWRRQGVDPALLTEVDFVDLKGAVVTPGLIDSHFHITSWSKKIPDPGERFGYYADMSDPNYYWDSETDAPRCIRGALWHIVADACAFLSATNSAVSASRKGIFLHGFLPTQVDDLPPDGPGDGSYLFAAETPGGAATAYNPRYLLNRVGWPPGGQVEIPEAACAPDASDWPPPDYPAAPALLVHTSGQMCWFNSALLEAFNQRETEFWASAFEPLEITQITPPQSESDDHWLLQAARADGLFTNTTPPFPVDLVISGNVPEAHIPFQLEALEAAERTLTVTPLLPETLRLLTNAAPSQLRVVPFYRPISAAISPERWDEAAAFYGVAPATEGTANGHWDPRHPYDSNWYSGAERGLIQYFRDATGVWRPTGYAEHYVMRDLLASIVLEAPTVEDAMRFRRNVARWCHRHGLTGTHDIMFYRRRSNLYEFQSYEALSYDHQQASDEDFFAASGLRDTVDTGGYFLRVGLYYYLENEAEIETIRSLACPPNGPSDMERLRPPRDHPEYPGWIRWLGWKIQMDGGTGARTLLSNAPVPKPQTTHPWPTEDEAGHAITFQDHSFGLSTMTSEQEQVFDSRESAALYWLVRESDPHGPWHNPRLARDWTLLTRGVAQWIGHTVNADLLARDLRALDHVSLAPTEDDPENQDPAARMAEKVRLLFVQINSAYDRTLAVLTRIWYEQSRAPLPGVVVAHCLGDGAVDLWVRAIGQLKTEVEQLPAEWDALPDHWKSVVPDAAALSEVRREFAGERYRVEHLLNLSAYAINRVRNPGDGIDAQTTPATRNLCFSTQPSLLGIEGASIATRIFPRDQELWEIPHDDRADFWGGLPAVPRSPHHMPCPLYLRYDIPFSLSTDPPSVRDPRPALTVISAVARTPVRFDPGHWLDQENDPPPDYPRDYLVNQVYPPLGKVAGQAENPMQLTMEQALCAMTWWGAYAGGEEREMGAIAAPDSPGAPGWFADLVVWQVNPLAIRANGVNLEALGRMSPSRDPESRVAVVNDFLRKFRPAMTVVGGVPVFISPAATLTWQGRLAP